MAIDTLTRHSSTADLKEPAAATIDSDAATAPSEHGARGAFVVAGIAVAALFVGWLAFYFLLFMPRGSVG